MLEHLPINYQLSNFPNHDLKLVDNNLENKIRLSQKICSLALSLRKKEKIKVRQPLGFVSSKRKLILASSIPSSC